MSVIGEDQRKLASELVEDMESNLDLGELDVLTLLDCMACCRMALVRSRDMEAFQGYMEELTGQS
jgi:hypothetical protein